MSEPRQVQRMGNLSADFWQRQGDIGMQEHKDIYPDDEAAVAARGLWARCVNRYAINMYTSHFREGVEPLGIIPVGFAWQVAAPFAGVPGIPEYAFHSSIFRIYGANVANQYFLSDAVGTYSGREFVARIRVRYRARFMIRFDDGTDNNWSAIGLWSNQAGGAQLTYSWRTGGGAVTNNNLGTFYIGEYRVLRLWRNPLNVTYGYVIGEEGDYTQMLMATNATAWAVARVGWWLTQSSSIGESAYCDWFWNTFT